MEFYLPKIVYCLFVINRKIHVFRDKCAEYRKNNKAYQNTKDYQKTLKQFKARIRALYELKRLSLEKIRKEYEIEPVGYHISLQGVGYDFYKLGNYSFHDDKQTSNNCLGVLGEYQNINPFSPPKLFVGEYKTITFTKAVKLLQRFIK